MTAVFEKLQTYVSLLALPSKCVCRSWFSLKNLKEYKRLEKGGGLAWLSERSLGSGVRKAQFKSSSPLHIYELGQITLLFSTSFLINKIEANVIIKLRMYTIRHCRYAVNFSSISFFPLFKWKWAMQKNL